VRCISLWQPYASLWLSPAKLHETRHWSTRYRGPLLVHAAKRPLRLTDFPFMDRTLTKHIGARWPAELAYGAIIGRVELIDCISTNDWQPVTGCDEWLCGNWERDRYGWKRGPQFVRFATPIPYVGRQGFFSVPDDVWRAVA
jgi:activating signal cointegrator 1